MPTKRRRKPETVIRELAAMLAVMQKMGEDNVPAASSAWRARELLRELRASLKGGG